MGVGARLIAHAGNLVSLAKHPASTIQVLGAEKALFRALKTKKDTPKYGLIYHASLVGQVQAKNKGKMSRMLAAKAALALRYDAFGDGTDDNTMEIGISSRAKLEVRKTVMEGGKVEKSPFKKEEKKAGAFSVKSETMEYDGAADSTLKRKKEEAEVKEEAKVEAPPKKKKKKDKKEKKSTEEATPEVEEETTEVVAEVESAEPEKKKKKKKKKSKGSDEDEEVAAAAEKVEEMQVEEETVSESPKKKKKKKKSAE